MSQSSCEVSLSNFCVFVLSHENPRHIVTLKALDYCGYTGDIYIVIDDMDSKLQEYIEVFGKDHVCIFSKEKIAQTMDEMDISGTRNTVVYARNACFGFARELGYRYFIELDDDYKEFQFRYQDGDSLRLIYPVDLNSVFLEYVKFLNSSDKIYTVALGQNGDFIGGASGGSWQKQILRKAMNTFICDVNKPFTFNGRINEDVNTYCLEGSRGKIFFTYVPACINQIDTQQKGDVGSGMAEAYKGGGTYQKSFYTVMCCPSFVKINMMGDKYYRIHHNIKWNYAVPKIISSEYKKSGR